MGASGTTTLVLMGVSGAGKSVVMAALAERLGWVTAEGDNFHSPENVAKMRAGVPLTDEDRRPWLAALAGWFGAGVARAGADAPEPGPGGAAASPEPGPGGAAASPEPGPRAGVNAMVTCSALRRAYRDSLREGHPSVRFVHLAAAAPTLDARLRERRGHYMPPALLASQLEILEPLEADEPGAVVSADAPLPEVVDAIMVLLRG
jgi:gluconokinase